MKSKWTLVIIILMATALHAYKAFQTSGISGRIYPKNMSAKVWAIRGADTIAVIPSGGSFLVEAPPGVYKLIVGAVQPCKNILVESIEVSEGKTTDLGEIKIIQ